MMSLFGNDCRRIR